MKVLHTSDFHLGKKLYKKSRHEEHELFLNFLFNTIITEKINVLIIAGDIFDSPIPPTQSLKLYFDFLNKVSEVEHLQKIFIIAGNHDSGHFLEAPLSFLTKQKINVTGQIYHGDKKHLNYVDLKIEKKNIRIATLPFFRINDFVTQSDNIETTSIEEILEKNLKSWLNELLKDHNGPSILMAHHLFGSFYASGSEQTVTLSGLDSLPLSHFEKWDLLALGHIHKKQILKKERPLAVYSGSPLPMRFSESNNKFIYQYEFNDEGIKEYKEIKIPLSRLLIRLNVNKFDYLKKIQELVHEQEKVELHCYLELSVSLKPEESVLLDDILNELKNHDLEILNLIVSYGEQENTNHEMRLDDIFKLGPTELFTQFLDSQEVEKESQESLVKAFSKILFIDDESLIDREQFQ